MRTDALLRSVFGAMLCALPIFTFALERQDVRMQSSDTRHALANSTPWDTLSSEVAAREWNLTQTEWSRYRDLMQGRARYFAADMPPLMVLAMYAESDQQRDHYVEMLAQYERDRADRLLKVQRAYDAAMIRLFPNEKIIDLDLLRQQGKLPASSSIPGITQKSQDDRTPHFGDKLALFATPACGGCADKIRTLAAQYAIAPLEVYFKGDSPAFRQWLEQSQLTPDWLKQHGVTFAQDEGQSQQYQAAPGTVFIVRDRALLEMML